MDCFCTSKLKKGASILSIFSDVKEHLTARQVAEYYGIQVKRNGMTCCPFHDDKHPSMKIGNNYHCFACGVGGDAVDYVSRMFGLSQYEAALKLIDNFQLPIQAGKHAKLNKKEKERIRRKNEEQARIIKIKERFKRWCSQTIDILKERLEQIEQAGCFLKDQPIDIIFSEDYASLLHSEPIINYWLDILCMGSTEEKQELFMKGRRKVEKVAERVRNCGKRIMDADRGSTGCGNEQRRRCAF